MPKFNREQRFAVLKNIFDELGALSAQRSAARLQIPADEARKLVEAWESGVELVLPTAVAEPEADKHRERLAARESVRPQRPVTPQRYFRKEAAPERPQRPVTSKSTRVIRIPGISIPAEKETGEETATGYKGAKLRKGSHVQYENGMSVGVILSLGRDVSEVKWFRSGAVQSEVNKYLRKASR